jgi:PAS domain S-box-containing protein
MATVLDPPAEETQQGSASILLVDDRDENLMALEAVLRPLGHRLLTASSGDEALKILLKQEVAVILLDVQMPGLDGFETAAFIKQTERTRHIPIIFLTAINKEARHVFRGYSAGAVDYLFKPFDPEVLRSKVAVFIDLYEKKAALQQSEERFRKAFDHAPIGVALVSPKGRWVAVNRALREMLAREESELLDQPVDRVISTDDLSPNFPFLARELGASGRNIHRDMRLLRRNGEAVDALVSISFVNAGTPDAHFVVQLIDVSERKRLEEFREKFVASAAHELRTPASVVAGTASLLSKDGLQMSEAELERCFTLLERQSRRMAEMVNRLLDLTRLREGRMDISLETISLEELATAALEAAPPPDGKSVQIKVDPDVRVMADRECADHILVNLLVNAYRYGGPKVTVTGGRRVADKVELVVNDNGGGVPPELITRLFEPFTRGPDSVKIGGSGLGLALVKSMTDAIGGEVEYARRARGGASFIVRMVPADA